MIRRRQIHWADPEKCDNQKMANPDPEKCDNQKMANPDPEKCDNQTKTNPAGGSSKMCWWIRMQECNHIQAFRIM